MLLTILLALPAQASASTRIEALPALVEDASALSPDDTRIAISTRKEGVWVIDVGTKSIVFRIAPTSSVVEYVTWNEDGTALGLLHRNADIEIVDAATGKMTATLHSTSKNPSRWENREIHFAAGGTRIVAALGGPPTDIFSVSGGDRIAQIPSDEARTTTAMAVSRDGSLLALGDSTGHVSIWDARTAERLNARHVIPLGKDRRGRPLIARPAVHALAFDPAAKLLAVGGGECNVRLWTLGSDEPMREFPLCDHDVWGDLSIACVAFDSNGSRLLASTFGWWEVRAWDVASGTVLNEFDYGGGSCAPMRAWFTADDEHIVAGLGCKYAKVTGGISFPYLSFGSDDRKWVWFQGRGDFAWGVADDFFIVKKAVELLPLVMIRIRPG